jgi:hypothetical protein
MHSTYVSIRAFVKDLFKHSCLPTAFVDALDGISKPAYTRAAIAVLVLTHFDCASKSVSMSFFQSDLG